MGRHKHTLTPKKRRFVEEYLVDLNGAAAAVRAGYKPSAAKFTASHLLAEGPVQAEVARLQSQRAEKTAVTAERVLEHLWDNAILARGTKDFTASNAAFVKCGEHVGMWKKGAALNVHVNLDELSDAQLAHLAAGGDLGDLPKS